jgi:demethylmenaquinone methyltransferase/2-methoxy-6-polyprenyl-1,4-benzoquinol methylase
MSDTVSFGYEEVSPEEKTERVGAVFSSVAKNYDRMNDAMSGGMHRLWKDKFVRRVKPQPGEQILDMAGGTGDIAFRMAARCDNHRFDINQDMLDVGIERAMDKGLDDLVWSRQNAETLSFPGPVLSMPTPSLSDPQRHPTSTRLWPRRTAC